MRKIIYSVIILAAFQFTAKAQWQVNEVKHKADSYPYDVEVPNDHTVWASMWENLSAGDNKQYTNKYLRTKDGGSSWTYNTLSAPSGYVISSMFPLDEDTCYAMMFNEEGSGGGLFKTTDGGANWNQLGTGVLFANASFPDWVYFWNAREGIAMGDANGPGDPYLEIYTTEDYGTTWTRVPRENFPVTADVPFGITNSYTVSGNTIWFQEIEGDPTYGPQSIYRSTDKGLHWESFLMDLPSHFADFTFTDAQHGVIVGNDASLTPYLYQSSDGGETWASVAFTGPLQSTFVASVPGAPTTLVSTSAAAVGGGSSYSYDLGNSWTAIDEAIGDGENQHSDVKFLTTSIGWSGQYRQFGTGAQPGGMYQWIGTVLPVTLSSFTVTKGAKSAILNWQTAQESNNAYFAIERSKNGTDFAEIGKVNGKGNSTLAQQYAYEDFGISNGQNYYRLKQVNNDGKYTYSAVVSVEFTGNTVCETVSKSC